MAHVRPLPAQGNQTPSTHVPGLVRGPVTGLGWTTERWYAGEHAERRIRELRSVLGPGAVTTSTVRDTSALWRGEGGETLVVTEISYRAGAKVPPPSAAGAVRAAARREGGEIIDTPSTIVVGYDPQVALFAFCAALVAASMGGA